MKDPPSAVSVDSSQQHQHAYNVSLIRNPPEAPVSNLTPQAKSGMSGTTATPSPFVPPTDPTRAVSAESSKEDESLTFSSSEGGVASGANGVVASSAGHTEPASIRTPDDSTTKVRGKRTRKARHDDYFCFVNEGSRGASSNAAEASDTTNGKGKHKPAPKRRRQKTTEEEFDTVWICSECKEAECLIKPEADTLLICDGKCRRVFHYPCVGLSELPNESEAFYCPDCVQQRHRCAICQDYGMDDDEVFCCSKTNCGLFFHSACLAMQNVEVQYDAGEDASTCDGRDLLNGDSDGASSGPSPSQEVSSSNLVSPSNKETIRFVCPAHNCWTCTQLDFKQQEQDELQAQRRAKPGSRKIKGKLKCTSVFDAKSERYLIVRERILQHLLAPSHVCLTRLVVPLVCLAALH
jgi:hypothetical protein